MCRFNQKRCSCNAEKLKVKNNYFMAFKMQWTFICFTSAMWMRFKLIKTNCNSVWLLLIIFTNWGKAGRGWNYSESYFHHILNPRRFISSLLILSTMIQDMLTFMNPICFIIEKSQSSLYVFQPTTRDNKRKRETSLLNKGK